MQPIHTPNTTRAFTLLVKSINEGQTCSLYTYLKTLISAFLLIIQMCTRIHKNIAMYTLLAAQINSSPVTTELFDFTVSTVVANLRCV